MIDVWLFLAVPWVCLQFVIVVFPDHTHFLYFISVSLSNVMFYVYDLFVSYLNKILFTLNTLQVILCIV